MANDPVEGTAGYDHAASFGRHAAAYAAHRPTYPPALFDWLATVAPGRALAVDVGAGGGQAALALAERFDRVIATDRSAELLDTIAKHPRLTTIAQDAEALDLSSLTGSGADLVLVAQALHWFAGDRFWARVRATARPGGVFAAVGYSWFAVTPEVDAILADVIAALDPHWSPRNRLLFDGYRTLAIPFDELAPPPPLAITLDWTRAELLAYLGTWSAVTALRELGTDVLGDVAPRLAAAWPGDERRRVTMPIVIRAFRVG